MAPGAYSSLANWDGSVSPTKQSGRLVPRSTLQGMHSTATGDDRYEESTDRLAMGARHRVQHGIGVSLQQDAYVAPLDPLINPLLSSGKSQMERESAEPRPASSLRSQIQNILFSDKLPAELDQYGPHAASSSIQATNVSSSGSPSRATDAPTGPSEWLTARFARKTEVVDLTQLSSDDEADKVEEDILPSIPSNGKHSVDSGKSSAPPSGSRQSDLAARNIRSSSVEISTLQNAPAATTDSDLAGSVPRKTVQQSSRFMHIRTSSSQGSPIRELSRSSFQPNEVEDPSSSAVSMLHAPDLERDMSVVPETPGATPSPSRQPSPEMGNSTASPIIPGGPTYLRSQSTSSAVLASSIGESTLVDSSQVKTSLPKAFVMRPQTPSRRAMEVIESSSPLSSLSSSEPLQVRMLSARAKGKSKAQTNNFYVFAPPFPLGRKKEDYAPMSSYVAKAKARSAEKRPAYVFGPQRLQQKAKRKREGSINSATSAPPRKKPTQRTLPYAKLSTPRTRPIPEMTLETFGDESHDTFAPYYEYFHLEANTRCEDETIEDRIPDPDIVLNIISHACRHLRQETLDSLAEV
ncbi:hypothetical protein NM688_g5668 [Phlebia brevispora]|uniref:Uncharacterized protein n=1 Tax=Phlebia brevispora TaxID=194682 RepID=A0ACC1SS92_9APHY|nr:hypothetical protein NM688_g5668 [Phlebia brevispora]